MTLPLPTGPHPTLEEIDRARRGAGDPAAKEAIAHMALCARCTAEEYRLDAFDRAEPLSPRKADLEWARFGPPVRRMTRPSSAVSWLPRLALAAAVVLAAAAVFLVSSRRGPEPVRSVPSSKTIGPQGVLDEAPRSFPVGRRGAKVFVFDAGRSYEWTSQASTGDRVEMPESERAKLKAGVDYYWTVLSDDASNPGGETTASKRFRLR